MQNHTDETTTQDTDLMQQGSHGHSMERFMNINRLGNRVSEEGLQSSLFPETQGLEDQNQQ